MSTSAKPAAASLARYSAFLERAGDAADPQLHVLAHVGRAPRRAPRRRRPRSGRRASARGTPREARASLSADRLITQFEMITSTELSGSGMCSISPLQELDVRQRRTSAGSRARARASRRSCRGRRPCRSGRRAAPRAARRCRRPSRGRAPSRPRSARRAPSGCRSRARRRTASTGKPADLRRVVEIRGDRVAAAGARSRSCHSRSWSGPGAARARGLAVFLLHDGLDVDGLGGHEGSGSRGSSGLI